MKNFQRITITIFAIFLFPNLVSAYTVHDPILIENIHSTIENPYVIEGYEITNPSGPCIQVRHVNHIIIKNNYLHDCGTEISGEIQEKIKNGGDARLAMMRNPDKTGAINVFNPITIEVSNNKVINNDYGIKIKAYDQRIKNANIYNNTVHSNHRAHFIWVQKADNVNIQGNSVKDNGLSMFIDNEGLTEAFENGEDFADGRAQGILCHDCNHVKIHDNEVINANSDGIGIAGDEDDEREGVFHYATDFEIYNNTIMWNAEQGIWIVIAKNGKIYNNKIWKNTARTDTTGGSSGILFEAHVDNIEIYDNSIAYNDMAGIMFALSTNLSIHDNDIHHNVDGAIGWTNWVGISRVLTSKGLKNEGVKIINNSIHDNMGQVFTFDTDTLADTVFVDGNKFEKNGMTIRHFDEFEDHDISNHHEIWEYNGKTLFFNDKDKKFINQFEIGTNIIDNKEVTGVLQSSKFTDADTMLEEIKGLWKNILIIILLLVIIIIVVQYFRKKY